MKKIVSIHFRYSSDEEGAGFSSQAKINPHLRQRRPGQRPLQPEAIVVDVLPMDGPTIPELSPAQQNLVDTILGKTLQLCAHTLAHRATEGHWTLGLSDLRIGLIPLINQLAESLAHTGHRGTISYRPSTDFFGGLKQLASETLGLPDFRTQFEKWYATESIRRGTHFDSATMCDVGLSALVAYTHYSEFSGVFSGAKALGKNLALASTMYITSAIYESVIIPKILDYTRHYLQTHHDSNTLITRYPETTLGLLKFVLLLASPQVIGENTDGKPYLRYSFLGFSKTSSSFSQHFHDGDPMTPQDIPDSSKALQLPFHHPKPDASVVKELHVTHQTTQTHYGALSRWIPESIEQTTDITYKTLQSFVGPLYRMDSTGRIEKIAATHGLHSIETVMQFQKTESNGQSKTIEVAKCGTYVLSWHEDVLETKKDVLTQLISCDIPVKKTETNVETFPAAHSVQVSPPPIPSSKKLRSKLTVSPSRTSSQIHSVSVSHKPSPPPKPSCSEITEPKHTSSAITLSGGVPKNVIAAVVSGYSNFESGFEGGSMSHALGIQHEFIEKQGRKLGFPDAFFETYLPKLKSAQTLKFELDNILTIYTQRNLNLHNFFYDEAYKIVYSAETSEAMAFVDKRVAEAIALKPGDFLLWPGGYHDYPSVGHALLYEVHKREDGSLSVYVLDSSSGLGKIEEVNGNRILSAKILEIPASTFLGSSQTAAFQTAFKDLFLQQMVRLHSSRPSLFSIAPWTSSTESIQFPRLLEQSNGNCYWESGMFYIATILDRLKCPPSLFYKFELQLHLSLLSTYLDKNSEHELPRSDRFMIHESLREVTAKAERLQAAGYPCDEELSTLINLSQHRAIQHAESKAHDSISTHIQNDNIAFNHTVHESHLPSTLAISTSAPPYSPLVELSSHHHIVDSLSVISRYSEFTASRESESNLISFLASQAHKLPSLTEPGPSDSFSQDILIKASNQLATLTMQFYNIFKNKDHIDTVRHYEFYEAQLFILKLTLLLDKEMRKLPELAPSFTFIGISLNALTFISKHAIIQNPKFITIYKECMDYIQSVNDGKSDYFYQSGATNFPLPKTPLDITMGDHKVIVGLSGLTDPNSFIPRLSTFYTKPSYRSEKETLLFNLILAYRFSASPLLSFRQNIIECGYSESTTIMGYCNEKSRAYYFHYDKFFPSELLLAPAENPQKQRLLSALHSRKEESAVVLDSKKHPEPAGLVHPNTLTRLLELTSAAPVKQSIDILGTVLPDIIDDTYYKTFFDTLLFKPFTKTHFIDEIQKSPESAAQLFSVLSTHFNTLSQSDKHPQKLFDLLRFSETVLHYMAFIQTQFPDLNLNRYFLEKEKFLALLPTWNRHLLEKTTPLLYESLQTQIYRLKKLFTGSIPNQEELHLLILSQFKLYQSKIIGQLTPHLPIPDLLSELPQYLNENPSFKQRTLTAVLTLFDATISGPLEWTYCPNSYDFTTSDASGTSYIIELDPTGVRFFRNNIEPGHLPDVVLNHPYFLKHYKKQTQPIYPEKTESEGFFRYQLDDTTYFIVSIENPNEHFCFKTMTVAGETGDWILSGTTLDRLDTPNWYRKSPDTFYELRLSDQDTYPSYLRVSKLKTSENLYVVLDPKTLNATDEQVLFESNTKEHPISLLTHKFYDPKNVILTRRNDHDSFHRLFAPEYGLSFTVKEHLFYSDQIEGYFIDPNQPQQFAGENKGFLYLRNAEGHKKLLVFNYNLVTTHPFQFNGELNIHPAGLSQLQTYSYAHYDLTIFNDPIYLDKPLTDQLFLANFYFLTKHYEQCYDILASIEPKHLPFTHNSKLPNYFPISPRDRDILLSILNIKPDEDSSVECTAIKAKILHWLIGKTVVESDTISPALKGPEIEYILKQYYNRLPFIPSSLRLTQGEQVDLTCAMYTGNPFDYSDPTIDKVRLGHLVESSNTSDIHIHFQHAAERFFTYLPLDTLPGPQDLFLEESMPAWFTVPSTIFTTSKRLPKTRDLSILEQAISSPLDAQTQAHLSQLKDGLDAYMSTGIVTPILDASTLEPMRVFLNHEMETFPKEFLYLNDTISRLKSYSHCSSTDLTPITEAYITSGITPSTVSMDIIFALFVRGEMSAYKEKMPWLNYSEIRTLYQTTGHLLGLMHRIIWVKKAYTAFQSGNYHNCATICYNAQRQYTWEHPNKSLFIAFEGLQELTLRQRQYELLEGFQTQNLDSNTILLAIMGSGKTAGVAPLWLLQEVQKQRALPKEKRCAVMMVVTDAQKVETSDRIGTRLAHMGTPLRRFVFERGVSDISVASVNVIYERLLSDIYHGYPFSITFETIKVLRSSVGEALLEWRSTGKNIEKFKALRNLYTLIYQGKKLMDEVDDILDNFDVLNFPLGQPIPIHPLYTQCAMDISDIVYKSEPFREALIDFEKKGFVTLYKDPVTHQIQDIFLMPEGVSHYHTDLLPLLIEALKPSLIEQGLHQSQWELVSRYLTGNAQLTLTDEQRNLCEKIVQTIYENNSDLGNRLVILKDYLSSVFPHLLQQKHKENWGVFVQSQTDETGVHLSRTPGHEIAVPFASKDKPVGRTTLFQDIGLTALATVTEYYRDGLSDFQLKNLFDTLKKEVELHKKEGLPISTHPAQIQYAKWVSETMSDTLLPASILDLDLNSRDLITHLQVCLGHFLPVIQYYLSNVVAPQIQFYRQEIGASVMDMDAPNPGDMKGMSGTMGQQLPLAFSLDQRSLPYTEIWHTLLKPENKHVYVVDHHPRPSELVTQLISGQFDSLIDAGAFLKGYNTPDFIHACFSNKDFPFDHIVYVADNGIYQGKIVYVSRPASPTDTLTPQIFTKPLANQFSYFSNADIRGIDITQHSRAKTLITGNLMSASTFVQAANRMRELNKQQTLNLMLTTTDKQSIIATLQLPPDTVITLEHYLCWLEIQDTQKKDTQIFTLAIQHIQDIARERVFHNILEQEIPNAELIRLYELATVSAQAYEPYQRQSSLLHKEETQTILKHYCDHIKSTYESILTSDDLRDLDTIVETFLPLLSPIRSTGLATLSLRSNVKQNVQSQEESKEQTQLHSQKSAMESLSHHPERSWIKHDLLPDLMNNTEGNTELLSHFYPDLNHTPPLPIYVSTQFYWTIEGSNPPSTPDMAQRQVQFFAVEQINGRPHVCVLTLQEAEDLRESIAYQPDNPRPIGIYSLQSPDFVWAETKAWAEIKTLNPAIMQTSPMEDYLAILSMLDCKVSLSDSFEQPLQRITASNPSAWRTLTEEHCERRGLSTALTYSPLKKWLG